MNAKTFCALVAGFALAASAAETKIPVAQLPPAVQKVMKKQTAGSTILGASKEREHGRMTYEVETKRDGKGRDLTFAEDGSLMEVEQEMALDNVPAPARIGIQKKAGGGTIKKVESVTQGTTTSYEADVQTQSGKTQEVAVNADGSPHDED